MGRTKKGEIFRRTKKEKLLFVKSETSGSEQRYFWIHLYLPIAPCFHHRHDDILCGHERQLLPDPPVNHLQTKTAELQECCRKLGLLVSFSSPSESPGKINNFSFWIELWKSRYKANSLELYFVWNVKNVFCGKDVQWGCCFAVRLLCVCLFFLNLWVIYRAVRDLPWQSLLMINSTGSWCSSHRSAPFKKIGFDKYHCVPVLQAVRTQSRIQKLNKQTEIQSLGRFTAPSPPPSSFWHSCRIIKDATLHMLTNYLPLDILQVPRRCSAVYSGWYQPWEKPQPGTHAYEHRYPGPQLAIKVMLKSTTSSALQFLHMSPHSTIEAPMLMLELFSLWVLLAA